MKAAFFGLILVASASISSASIITAAEAVGVQSSTLANTLTETFNSRPQNAALGAYVSPIGTYSVGARVVAADAYGGSNATRYVSVGAQSDTLSYSLTFASLQSYFGLFWGAGDSQNRLEFYNGVTLVQTVQVSDYFASLSNAYFGNPNNGQNTAEKYAFLNFTSNNVNTNFNRIVFRNVDASTGFETDNHTILAGVPEPSSIALMIAGLGMVAIARRRRR